MNLQVDQGIQMTEEITRSFLTNLMERGRSKRTIHTYRYTLIYLYKFLPPDKTIRKETGANWKVAMENQKFSNRTIYGRLCILNTFLDYLAKPEWCVRKRKLIPVSEEWKCLTRAEYLQLLKTAKLMGRHRGYLLIKTIVNTGIKTQELPNLTVNALQKGTAWVAGSRNRRQIPLLEPLRSELLAYASQESIIAGPVFATKDGKPMKHSHVWKEIKQICRWTGLPEERGTPKDLKHLYIATYQTICADSPRNVEQRYLELLEFEECQIAWDQAIN